MGKTTTNFDELTKTMELLKEYETYLNSMALNIALAKSKIKEQMAKQRYRGTLYKKITQ